MQFVRLKTVKNITDLQNIGGSSGYIAAAYARNCAYHHGIPDYAKLSDLLCWDAVIYCAYKSGAISKSKFITLCEYIRNMKFSAFIAEDDPMISSMADMQKVPLGSFLGFFAMYGNQYKLVHTMIAVGSGCAAGNKNISIGLGNSSGWEILDLANKLRWIPEANTSNMVAIVQLGKALMKIRYRALDR